MNAVIPAPAHRRRGRPPCCPPELAIRIIRLRRQGLSYAAISRTLNADGILTRRQAAVAKKLRGAATPYHVR